MTKMNTSHKRILTLKIVLFFVMAIFVVRLFYIQIIQHDNYVAQASQEQVKKLVVPAKRGEIYALSDGQPVKLVMNETVFTVFADPSEVTEPDAVAKAVKEIAGGSAVENLSEKIRETNRYQVLAKSVSRQQAQLLKKKNLKGVGFQEIVQRVYPEGKLAGQSLGFVNNEGRGQYGVEGYMDKQLAGKDGILQSVTDVRNVPLTIGENNVRQPAVDGTNIVLTIDRNIQSYTERALSRWARKIGATNGSIIVMDPQNGQVLSMANIPNYNPADYSNVPNASVYNNAVVSAPYEPGSVIKTFTVATGIDRGVINANSTYVNTDSIQVADRTIHNASRGQTGTITMQHALNWSLNTGMVTIGERLGNGSEINLNARKTIYDYLHNKFRLGEKTGIELAGEEQGEIISPDNVQGNAVRYSNMTFGQGMNPTMVQVAAGFSSIVNGGEYYKPTVIAGEIDKDGDFKPKEPPKPTHRTISKSASKQAKQMIHNARAAFYSRVDKPGYDIGGKTGTSETLINGRYTDNQTVGNYLGYGGDSIPRYVIMVQVSASGRYFGGNTETLPIFTDISNWMIDYKKLQPKGESER